MLDRRLRKVKERILAPVALKVGHIAHPTTLTFLGGVAGVLTALAGWQGWYVAGFFLWGVNRLLDGLDGTVARLHKKSSDLGGYIDILVDFAVYALVPTLLAIGRDDYVVMIALAFMLTTFYLNAASWMYLSSLLEKRQQGASAHRELTTITMPTGLIEGTETVLIYALFFLLPHYLTALYVLMSLLVLVTVGQRLIWAIQKLGKSHGQ